MKTLGSILNGIRTEQPLSLRPGGPGRLFVILCSSKFLAFSKCVAVPHLADEVAHSGVISPTCLEDGIHGNNLNFITRCQRKRLTTTSWYHPNGFGSILSQVRCPPLQKLSEMPILVKSTLCSPGISQRDTYLQMSPPVPTLAVKYSDVRLVQT